MNKPISITAISSLSSLGSSQEDIWNNYQNSKHYISEKEVLDKPVFVSQLSSETKQNIEVLRHSDSKYKSLDETVLYAIYASRQAVKLANWNAADNFGVNIGSSRGATGLFETYHQSFLENHKAETLSSPTTTLGNISSWVAHDLQTQGPEISHSITCSTALHSVLNGIAWINSGMCDKFLVGGSEAPLTSFTIAQMQALKIYSKETGNFPCRALDLDKTKNTMVLGEGASMICLEAGETKNALATIKGFGYATEILKHNISISSDAKCFQKSMKMALGSLNPEAIDVIVMHAPGTVKGDASEYKAIQKLFKDKIPALTSNKWKIGHTFGASGALSLELATLMIQKQKYIDIPYLKSQKTPKTIKNIIINAVGFGGNAVSILLSKN
ncbi:beta-ketoacyl synthase N-terminal-like domain-containing protein [Hyunsoonleella pacifica]|uniref:Beta-ketoacyl synthase n=1 Tax=Hyunsoonleella pacifica TaxID=1080224 RepID=A0A4Q9FQL5_9FLAO|nr:beta-ketoacyl synthase N-terminal-like domain-containing protein [Hyunsoonleella pacifica]TBN16531.1 beta-ketoacyl synthase [Hyunsoonleella pacifica]